MRICYAAAVVLLLFAQFLPAQDTRGAITGVVTDPQGAVLVGASVQVTNADTNTSVGLKTNSAGLYQARLLQPGNYKITVEASGFKKLVRTGFVVRLGEESQIDLRMEVGAMTESITVAASSPILETDSVTTGRALTTRELMDLPVMSNNIVIQAMLTAGIASTGLNAYVTQGQVNGSSQPYYAPGNVGGSEWTIDGAPNNGNNRRTGYTPSTDAVEEFKVETSNFDASTGHSTGLSVQMQTKSGTNSYHGTALDSYWNTRFNAASFFQKQAYYQSIATANAAGNTARADSLAAGPTTPGGHSNNYSGTFGGPVWIPKIYNGKNRLFFFLSYAGAKDRQPARPSDINYTVATAQQRAGNFSDLTPYGAQYTVYDPFTVAADPSRAGHFVRTPFPGNIVPQSRFINPAYQFINKYVPLPNANLNNPTAVNYIATCQIDNSDYTAIDQRTDYQLNQSNRINVRWNYTHYFEPQGDYTCTGLQSGDEVRVQKSAVVSWTHTFGSATILDAAVSTTSFIDRFTYLQQHTFKPTSVGLPSYVDDYCNAHNATCELPVFNLAGYQSIGTGGAGYPFDRTLNFKVNLSHIRGKHTIRTGFETRDQIHSDPGTPGNASGQFSFNNYFTRKDEDGSSANASLGLTWAALQLGLPQTASIDNNSSNTLSNPWFGWYGQDSWHVRNNLTVTLGLRMEYELPPTDRYNRLLFGFDPAAQLPIAAAAQAAYAAAPVAQLAASMFKVIGGNRYAGAAGASRSPYNAQLMYMPRLSVAWHFTPKMVFRAGYGKYYDSLNVNNEQPSQSGFSRTTVTTTSNDFGQTFLVGNPRAGISPVADPFPVRADGSRYDTPYGNTIGAMYQAGKGYTFVNPDRRRNNVQKWRAGFQREITHDIVVEAAYWGQWGSDLSVTENLSAVPSSYYNFTETRNTAPGTLLNANVTNPFYIGNFASIQSSSPSLYQVLSSNSFFTSKTIQLNKLIVPFPQIGGLSEANVPLGRDQINAVELNFTKRFARGFNFTGSYTWLHGRDKTQLANPYDVNPIWLPSNSSRPRRLTMSGIYEMPFGKGKAFANHGIIGQLVGGWQVSGTYQYQPGSLIGFGNLLYTGDLSTIADDLRTGCTPRCNQINSWFNTSLPGFVKNSANTASSYQARVFPFVIDGIRGDKQSIINANLLRNFKLREHTSLQIRLDATNLQNRSQFNNPNADPTSSQFGKATTQTGTVNRFYNVQARLQF